MQLIREIMVESRAGQAALDHPGLQHLRAQLARLLPELTPADSLPPTAAASEVTGTKLLLFDAISQWLSRVTADRPWLLIIDDLHRAEPATTELLSYLLPALRRMRCMIIATVRDPELTQGHDRTGLRRVRAHRNCHELQLLPLDAHQVGDYVSASLGQSGAPEISERVYRLSAFAEHVRRPSERGSARSAL
ncbi:MAG TPA: ATP-binding protein [Polyangiales bacterium]|nr:ATP-binding protein [Polyangiales bacterium]